MHKNSKMNCVNGRLNTKLLAFDGKNWNQWSIEMSVLFGVQDVIDLVNDDYVPVTTDATEA